MVIDFSRVDMREPPMLILRNLDGTAIQTLGYALRVTPTIHYNEVSELAFDYPAFVDHIKTPHYDQLVGMKIIDWHGVGQFILTNPDTKQSGASEMKSCKANSLEYEFTFKTISIPNGTYNFYNPADMGNTILGMILESMPSWSVGAVDPSLTGKYRTFEENGSNIYNFIKGTLQESYSCIFDFDTYARKINVRDTASDVATAPVYISLENLAKEIEIKENTEDIFTCLDISGAEGVSIRSVNPLGTNKLYDYSHFMTTDNFSQAMIDKWNAWKLSYKNAQLSYFNTTVQAALQEARCEAECASLTTLKGELGSLTTLQSTYVQGIAQGLTTQPQLDEVNVKIAAKEMEIRDKTVLIASVRAEIEALYSTLKSVNTSVSFSAFFTPSELKTLNRYQKEARVQDSTFAISEHESLTNVPTSSATASADLAISSATIHSVESAAQKTIYSMTGGTLTMKIGTTALSASMVRGAFERKAGDGSFVFTAYLNAGTYGTEKFAGGCLSMTGGCGTVTDDLSPDLEIPVYRTGTSLSTHASSAYFYLTKNATEYEQRSVEWDLFDFGTKLLADKAYPTYTFSVQCGNFFSMEEFVSFRNQLKLGNKIYLRISEETVLQPICIGVSLNFEKLDSFSLEFGDQYGAAASEFKLVDLLEKSISAGKTTNFSKYNYNSFQNSGAMTSVDKLLHDAILASNNAVISAIDQSIIMDGSGMRFRKARPDGSFDPEQIWMINNNIVFTEDNWAHAKLAIGKFEDSNAGKCWGICAPNIIGTLLAGANLIIESAKKSGGVAVFKMDADGARLYNSQFLVQSDTGGQVALDPAFGLAVGGGAAKPLYTLGTDGKLTLNTDNATLYTDLTGNLHMKGDVTANNFYFNDGGNVKTLLSQAQKKISSDFLDVYGLTVTNKTTKKESFAIDNNGNVSMHSGSISWDAPVVEYQYSSNNASWHVDEMASDKYRRDSSDGGKTWSKGYQYKAEDGKNGLDGAPGTDANVPKWVEDYTKTATFINNQWVISPNIAGGSITALEKMKATCDFEVGNNILIGKGKMDEKAIIFKDMASISTRGDGLTIDAMSGMTLWAGGGGIRFGSSTGALQDVDFTRANVIGLSTVATFG